MYLRSTSAPHTVHFLLRYRHTLSPAAGNYAVLTCVCVPFLIPSRTHSTSTPLPSSYVCRLFPSDIGPGLGALSPPGFGRHDGLHPLPLGPHPRYPLTCIHHSRPIPALACFKIFQCPPCPPFPPLRCDPPLRVPPLVLILHDQGIHRLHSASITLSPHISPFAFINTYSPPHRHSTFSLSAGCLSPPAVSPALPLRFFHTHPSTCQASAPVTIASRNFLCCGVPYPPHPLPTHDASPHILPFSAPTPLSPSPTAACIPRPTTRPPNPASSLSGPQLALPRYHSLAHTQVAPCFTIT